MILRQEILKTFLGKKTHKIVFSPRLYYWYFGNKIYSNLKKNYSKAIPTHYYGKTQLDIYKDLGSSPRYSEETLYLPLYYEIINPLSHIKVQRETGTKKGQTITIHKTPHGKLTQVESIGSGLGGHRTEYPIKTLADIETMRYILKNTAFSFSRKNFELADKQFGDTCVTLSLIHI